MIIAQTIKHLFQNLEVWKHRQNFRFSGFCFFICQFIILCVTKWMRAPVGGLWWGAYACVCMSTKARKKPQAHSSEIISLIFPVGVTRWLGVH